MNRHSIQKLLFFSSVVIFSVPLVDGAPAAQPPAFIVKDDPVTQSPPKSKTVLKEKMGDSLEEVMQVSAQLHKSLGSLQVTLSHIQTQLVKVSRDLLDNSGQVKKASRAELQNGLSTLQAAAQELKKQVASVTAVHEKVNKVQCLKAG